MTVAPTPVHSERHQRPAAWLIVALVAILVGGLALALLYRFDVLGGSTTAGTKGSGIPATESRDVAAFDGIELAGSNNLVIHVGEKQSVVVAADDNLLDRVTTEVQSGKLVVGNTQGSFTTRSPMRVDVDVPTLAEVTLTGSGNIVIDGVDSESLSVSLLGSGTVTGSGAVTRLDVTVSGSGDVRLTRLVADDVGAIVSGSGSIFVTANESLDGSVPGSGAIVYAGDPASVTKSVTGSGAITPR